MARVAVITAPNIGYRNTGMLTVDLAFETMRRRMGGGIEANWYTLHAPETVALRPGARGHAFPFRFRSLIDEVDDLREHDAVVFWGDFLHARHYLAQDATNRLLDFGFAEDRGAARALLNRTLLLADQPDELLSRTLSYGGTILHNTQSDYEDKEYGPLFTRLMTRSRRVWVRDPLSAVKLARLRGDRTTDHFGSDAALLNRPGDLGHLPVTPWSQDLPEGGAIGVFLGARTEIPDWLPGFCQGLAERFGAPLEWVPWFDRDVPPRVEHIARRPGDPTVGDLIGVLPRYRLVVTDTYHLAVNAWGAGTPVVCVGAPEPVPTTDDDYLTLSDVKKHVFHMAYDAADFYLSTVPDSPEGHARRADRIVRLVEGGGAAAVAARIREHADHSAHSFTETLAALLS
ncbi:polysaccharide pyruvyl transferase family protein [Streptomyces sp. NEAU-sy36]|uniref:polysaccharide pyruvyl transferase family protein n=1 Tax=unclassified Streptomyces TaxID=2593676 RepID=UPI0015D5CF7D|nr:MULTISPECIES: polysaccharide pyruvyl transferase family protein [unclassified Streptomyces]QLI99834.1 polysaccharide pyruvyl transferase family protein [Streptomyces sp. NEAU-sy36]